MHPLATVAAVLAAVTVFAAFAPQGKESPQGKEPARPAPPPAGAPMLPPIDEPFTAPVPRSDVLLRFDRPDGLEGFYQLRRRVVAGTASLDPGEGYLAVGRRHLLLQVSAPTDVPTLPLLRSNTWRWQRVDNKLQLTVLLGMFNDADGQLHLEQPGSVVVRDIEQLGDVLRIYQDQQSYLEFKRAE